MLSPRQLFLSRLARRIRGLRASRDNLALFVVDIDQLRRVNARFGCAAGDAMLDETIRRLAEHFGTNALVAPIGGDEVAVVARVADEPTTRSTAQRVRRSLSLMHGGTERVPMSASIGFTVLDATADPARALAEADAAMREAKLRDDHIARFETVHAERYASELSLQIELQHALEREEFRLHYQPIIRCNHGSVIGFEALLRWQHPTRGLLAPGAFLDALVEANLLVDVGNWVAGEACRQALAWRPQIDVRIGINLGAQQLAHPAIADDIAGIIRSVGVDASMLVFEVTENAPLTDLARAAHALEELRANGAGIALDDFGTGYSSLAYLRDLPLDSVKLDRVFVQDLERSEQDRKLITGIISLAHSVGLNVIAEGAETAAQLEAVRALGCDGVQGYFVSRPVSADEALRFALARA